MVVAVELIIVVSVTALIVLTTYYLARDIRAACVFGSTAELQLIMNDIFLLIVYAELIRSILVAYRRPEMYLVGIAEVGFVITVREVLASVISRTTMDLALASASSLILAIVLWILYKKVLPHKRGSKESVK
ncbi:MAG: hypothetical protein B6U73_01085 [Desulfurococcales archaeon ex4484_204]|nr:MAG: hypothetical protein B6U73_01085 [Desulfurococcales archaeon ex4484_204]